MKPAPFDPRANVLTFECFVEYKRSATLVLALDTGASMIVLSEEALKNIGYDLSKEKKNVTFTDASQSHLVPKVVLKSISLSGVKVENIEALSYTIPEEHGIDGVIGLNYLRHFKRVILDFENGLLMLVKNSLT